MSLLPTGLVFCLDISGAQGPNLDFAKIRAAGISGTWLKATEGVGSPDGSFMPNCKKAHDAGLPYGAYHYLHVRAGGPSAQDGTAQADDFCDQYLAGHCELPPMVDVESAGQATTDTTSWRVVLGQFIKRVQQRLFGKTVVIYTSKGEWESFGLGIATEFKPYPLWLANTSGGSVPPVPLPWTKPSLWQYSWKGQVEGVPMPVDVSLFYGGKGKLEAWAGRIPVVGKVVLGLGVLVTGVTVYLSRKSW